MSDVRISRWARGAVLLAAALALASGTAASPALAELRAVGDAPTAAPAVGSLGSLACPTASYCVGISGTESLIRVGTSWHEAAIPAPLPNTGLASVACASKTYCLAVGTGGKREGTVVSDAWNGKSWHSLPAPAGYQGRTNLSGVACLTATDCIAVGHSYLPVPKGTSSPVAARWNGHSWTRLTVPPAPAGAYAAGLSSISCAGTEASQRCLAVGLYITGSPEEPFWNSLAEWWNGSTWTLLPPPPATSGLASVSCGSVTTCVAVGLGPQQIAPYAREWNGTTWTSLTAPVPASSGPQPTLTAVSCPSATDCLAVGDGYLPFAEQWTGGTGFSLTAVPDPNALAVDPYGFVGAGSYDLSTISCPSTTSCLAAGGASGGSSQIASGAAFAATWNGEHWQALRTGRADDLLGVSCTKVWSCLLTGAYLAPSDNVSATAESWNGSKTRLVTPSHRSGDLAGVSCLSATFCMSSDLNSGARWTGHRWITTPLGAGAGTYPSDKISCASARFCMLTAIGGGGPTIYKWNGSTWSPTVVPQPAGDTWFAGAFDLSCPSSSFCLAVGGYATDPEGGIDQTLIETWNGTSWQIMPVPTAVTNDMLSAVHCVNRTNCQVVGPTGTGTLAAAQWNGHAWKLRSLPGSTGSFEDTPLSISCASAVSCMTVGTFSGTSAGQIADVWNGHAWKATRSLASVSELTAVSCPAPGHCLAVGTAGESTAAEQWNGHGWKLVKTLNP